MRNWKKPIAKLLSLITPVILIVSCGLTVSCRDGGKGSWSKYPASGASLNRNIYQAEILAIPSNVSIITEKGVYVTQSQEVWFSEGYVNRLKEKMMEGK